MPPRPITDWVALNLLPGLGPVLTRRALQSFGDPGTIAHRIPTLELRALGRVPADFDATIATARRGLRRRTDAELERAERLGIRLLPCDHPDYPAEFENLQDPPVLIYVRGELGRARARVGIVGARRATAYGRRVARELGEAHAACGIEVVSGGARGIDTCAHEGALDAGGPTLAVLGSGLARPYPVENEPLFERIGACGAVCSEFALNVAPHAGNFPRRNRLIAAFSAAVVVVEAGERSGSLITAEHALELGREVLAVPGPIHSEQSRGCHRLIQDGAKLVRGLDDVLEELPPPLRAQLRAPARARGAEGPDLRELTPDEAGVLLILDAVEPRHVDSLALAAPFGIARLQAALFSLELRRAVEQLPGRYYLSRPPKEP